jgi:hypothetical protein
MFPSSMVATNQRSRGQVRDSFHHTHT